MIDWTELSASIRLAEILDLLLVTGLVFIAIIWLRDSPARRAFGGVALLAALYFLARQFGLTLTSWVLQGFVAVSVFLIIVVFDQDLRRLFERLTIAFSPVHSAPEASGTVSLLAGALCRLAADFRGALIVLPGQEPLERHLEGGVPLDGRLSEVLLLSLFDPHSPGHDGAVILEGDRLTLFAVHLPLSSDHEQLGQRGTRHAAALGLSEMTDALCLVVSEERGEISVAHAGSLQTLERPEFVTAEIERFVQDTAEKPTAAGWHGVTARWREVVAAISVTAGLWLVAVPGSGGADLERSVPVRVYNLPEGYVLGSVTPSEVIVTFHGRRRDLLWLNDAELEARVYASLVDVGRRSFAIDPQQVKRPTELDVVSVRPEIVKIDVQRSRGALTEPK